MPGRDRRRQTTKDQAVRGRVSSHPKRRKLSFEAEPWYAEAARKLSAAKKPADMHG
jgi:hypothetical protein